jgi:hypothetical protein
MPNLRTIQEDLKHFLRLSEVVVRESIKNNTLTIDVADHYGEDLDLQEFKEVVTELTDEILDRVKTKFNMRIGTIIVRNLDTEERKVITAATMEAKPLAYKSSFRETSALGEDRDEVVGQLVAARDALLEAVDTLHVAKNLVHRTVSKKLAQTLDESVLAPLDSTGNSVLKKLTEVLKSLNEATLTYEE